MNSDNDFQPRCYCMGCQSLLPHVPGGCDGTATWYAAIHLVDACSQVEFGETRGVVCEPCLMALKTSALAIIAGGMRGTRYPLCATCQTPLVRLSNIITDIARV